MASESGTLYIGVTSDLIQRVYQHKEDQIEGFTKDYNCKKLVYYEIFEEIYDAITREKQLKGWVRKKKEYLIRSRNPKWKDIYEDLI